MIFKDYQFKQVMKIKIQKVKKKGNLDKSEKVLIYLILILLPSRLQKKIWNQADTTVHNLVPAHKIAKIL